MIKRDCIPNIQYKRNRGQKEEVAYQQRNIHLLKIKEGLLKEQIHGLTDLES